MNFRQKMFRGYVMSMVREDRRDEAERVLAEGFARQDEGTFDAAYLESMSPTYLALVKEEHVSKLKDAMAQFSSRL
ncbi:hypothetical protein [Olsenella urininfantis]|uniref:hypothetical protein n=1 Tax=Olsenella urininfantis TaxID=1871033 RepID=UPI000985D861|nr:hypothetical protein [Olsenella urininfantis]